MPRRLLVLAAVALLAVVLVVSVTRDPEARFGPPAPRPETDSPPRAAPGPLADPGDPASPDAPPSGPAGTAERRGEPTFVVEVRNGETGLRLPGARATPLASKSVDVELPQGFVLLGETPVKFGGTVCRWADRVRAAVVAWPEATVVVEVFDHEGVPVFGADLAEVWLGGRSIPANAEPTGWEGRTRVRGVPCIRGEPVVVSFAEGARRAQSASGRLFDTATDVRLTVKLPDPTLGVIGIGGGTGGAFGGRGDRRRLRAISGRSLSRITAVVTRRNGRPGAGALVCLTFPSRARLRHRADARGRSTFDGLVEGRYRLEVLEAGFLSGGAEEVHVGLAEERTVRLREARGRSVTVLVLDEGGRPVPCARISVLLPSGVRYCLMEGDVQTLTLLTGSDGRIVLPNLPVTGGRVFAVYGSRRAQADLTDRAFLELTLGKSR